MRDAAGSQVAGQGIAEGRPFGQQRGRGARAGAAHHAVIGAEILIKPEEPIGYLL